MRKRVVIGGLIAVGIVVGALLSGRLPGFGTGESGTEVQTTVQSDARPLSSKPDAAAPSEESPERESPTDSEALTKPTGVLDILIDGRSYAILQSPDNLDDRTPADLKELIELAKLAPGNEEGIRVRITRRKSARATAEILLKDELIRAGLSETSISWRPELVD